MIRVPVRQQDGGHGIPPHAPPGQLRQNRLARRVVPRIDQRDFRRINGNDADGNDAVLHNTNAIDLESVGNRLPAHKRRSDGHRRRCDQQKDRQSGDFKRSLHAESISVHSASLRVCFRAIRLHRAATRFR